MKKIKYRHFKKINNGHEVTQQIRTKKRTKCIARKEENNPIPCT